MLIFRCTNTDKPQCATCPKDFAVPSSAIQAFYRWPDGKVMIEMKCTQLLCDPNCGNPDEGATHRFIHVERNWDQFLSYIRPIFPQQSNVGAVTLVNADYGKE